MSRVIDAGTLRLMLEANPKGLQKTLKESDKQVAGFSASGAANIAKFGKAAAMGFTAIVAGATAAMGMLIKLGSKFEEASNTIRRGTGATGKALDELNASFKRVYATVDADSATVAKALADLNTRTGATGDRLEGLTKTVLDLSKVSGEAADALIPAVTRVFGDWSIATEKQADVLDWLWKVSQTTGIGISQLSSKVVDFGSPLRALGFSFEQATAMLGKFEQQGVALGAVLPGLKLGLAQFARAGEEPAKALERAIVAIKNAGSEAEANSIAFEVFGARAGIDMARAIIEGRFEIEELIGTLETSSETIQKAAEDTETLGDKWRKAVHKIEVALSPLAEKLVGHLEETFDEIADAAERGGWESIGQTIGESIGAGIRAATPLVVEAGSELAKALAQAVGLLPGPQPSEEEVVEALLGVEAKLITEYARKQGISIAQAYLEGVGQIRRLSVSTGEYRPLTPEESFDILKQMRLVITEDEIRSALSRGLIDEGLFRLLATETQRQAQEAYQAALANTPAPFKPNLVEGMFDLGGITATGSFGQLVPTFEAVAGSVRNTGRAIDDAGDSASQARPLLDSITEAYKGIIRPADAWTKAVEASKTTYEKAVDAMKGKSEEQKTALKEAWESGKTSMVEYLRALEEQQKAWANYQSNVLKMIDEFGGTFDREVIGYAASKGAEFMSAFWGADRQTQAKVLAKLQKEMDQNFTKLDEDMETRYAKAAAKAQEAWANAWKGYTVGNTYGQGGSYTPVSQGGKVWGQKEGEDFAQNWFEGYSSQDLPGKVSDSLSATDSATPARTRADLFADSFLAASATLPKGIADILQKTDARPAGDVIGSTLKSRIESQLRGLERMSFTIPLNFRLSPYEGEGGGPTVGGSRGAMLDFADNYIGRPYVWGGTTPAGWDCSGYMNYVLKRFGIKTPRTAAAMQAYFPKTSTPRPGDLLFYGRPATHVAMYYGNGQQIEARGKKWGTGIWPVRGYSSVGRVPMYDMGGWVGQRIGLPAPQRSTGQPVPAILHEGEFVLTENQARALASFATGGFVGAAYPQPVVPDALIKEVNNLVVTLQKTFKGKELTTAILDAFRERSDMHDSYLARENARNRMMEAYGASAERIAQNIVDNQLRLLTNAIAEAQQQVDMAVARKLPQEEVNKLLVRLYDLQGEAAQARARLEELARVPLEQAANRWSSAVGQLSTMMDLLGNHSNALSMQTGILPQLLGGMGAQYQTNVDLMGKASTPEQLMGYATSAIGALNSMFATEQGMVNRALQDTLTSIDSSQRAWENAWQARSDAATESINAQRTALSKQTEDQSRAHREQLDDLTRFYDDKLRLLDDREREITRDDQRRKAAQSIGDAEEELRILKGQGFYTEADIRRMRELEKQIQTQRDDLANQEAQWAREDERLRLQRERDEAIKSLQQQQELQRIALQDQIEAAQRSLEAQQKALQEQYRQQQQYFEQQREAARAAAQAEIDNLVVKYQQMMQTVIDQQNALLGEAMDYQNAGYTLGQSFAQGLIDALPLIQAAAQQAAQTAADYLQLHSPAKRGPLSDLDKWFEPFLPTLVRPLRMEDIARPAMDTAGAMRSEVVSGEVVHRYIFEGNAQGLDLRELARELAREMKQTVRVKGFGRG